MWSKAFAVFLLAVSPRLVISAGFCDVTRALDAAKPNGFDVPRGRVIEENREYKTYDLKLEYLLPGVERRGDCQVEVGPRTSELECRIFLRGFSESEIQSETVKIANVVASCLKTNVSIGQSKESGHMVRTANATWIVKPVFDAKVGGARLMIH